MGVEARGGEPRWRFLRGPLGRGRRPRIRRAGRRLLPLSWGDRGRYLVLGDRGVSRAIAGDDDRADLGRAEHRRANPGQPTQDVGVRVTELVIQARADDAQLRRDGEQETVAVSASRPVLRDLQDLCRREPGSQRPRLAAGMEIPDEQKSNGPMLNEQNVAVIVLIEGHAAAVVGRIVDRRAHPAAPFEHLTSDKLGDWRAN